MPLDLGTLADHIALPTTTMAVCWEIQTVFGESFYFTSCSHDLTVDGHSYKASIGLDPTSVEVALGLEVANSEVTGFLSDDGITATAIRAGKFDGATAYKFLVDYTDPASDKARLLWGPLGEMQIQSEVKFNAEIRGASQWLAADIVPLTQGICRAAFGDPVQCKATVHSDDGIVSTHGQQTLVAAGLIGARADGFYDQGYLLWTSGANESIRMDVRHYNQATGAITFMEAAILPVANGDTFTVYEGCAKTRPACKTKTGPSGVNNIINFDGEPDIPGNDTLLRIVRAH